MAKPSNENLLTTHLRALDIDIESFDYDTYLKKYDELLQDGFWPKTAMSIAIESGRPKLNCGNCRHHDVTETFISGVLRVSHCRATAMRWEGKIKPSTTALVEDSELFYAALYTTADHYCSMHEPKEKMDNG